MWRKDDVGLGLVTVERGGMATALRDHQCARVHLYPVLPYGGQVHISQRVRAPVVETGIGVVTDLVPLSPLVELWQQLSHKVTPSTG